MNITKIIGPINIENKPKIINKASDTAKIIIIISKKHRRKE